MKKRPPNLEAIAPARRKRALSDEERELWQSVVKQTKPLRRRKLLMAVEVAALTEGVKTPPPQAPSSSPKPARQTPLPKSAIVKPSAPPPLATLGRREKSQLSRGRKEIDARLDLHGMTQTRAHRALLNFLLRASTDGMTFVLVITGKGRTVGPDSERGVLRRQVPEWLSLPEFRKLVVGFETAHIGHGGEGALYVRVRRGR